jgi:perosamine synthetase
VRLRAQLPVYSPLGAAALLSGARAGLGGGRAARAMVDRLLREAYQPRGLLLTDSGTTALQLALRLAVAERPGPVALPAYCCYDVATAADAAGVGFVLYDLDPSTLGPDWSSLGRAFRRGARVAVAVHLYGIPVDLPAMEAMAREVGAVVIEDAAQGAGARVGGRAAGSLGRYAILSFGRGKGMTGGRGGALLANAADAAEHLTEIGALLGPPASGGCDAVLLLAQWILARPSLYGLPLSVPFLRLGETIYREPAPPTAPSRFALGTLARTLRLGPAEAELRRKNAAWLLERIAAGGPVMAPRPPIPADPGFLRLPVVVDPRAVARFQAVSVRSLGVWPGYPRPLGDLPGFGARRLDAAEPTPGARVLTERLFTLPTHGRLDRSSLTKLGELLDHP